MANSAIKPLLEILVLLFIIGALCEASDDTSSDTSEGQKVIWEYRTLTETSGAKSYIFNGDHRPPINKTGGSGSRLKDLSEINVALETVGLPPASENYTIRRNRAQTYYDWPEYPRGKLMVRFTYCGKDYDNCIWKIMIEQNDQEGDG